MIMVSAIQDACEASYASSGRSLQSIELSREDYRLLDAEVPKEHWVSPDGTLTVTVKYRTMISIETVAGRVRVYCNYGV